MHVTQYPVHTGHSSLEQCSLLRGKENKDYTSRDVQNKGYMGDECLWVEVTSGLMSSGYSSSLVNIPKVHDLELAIPFMALQTTQTRLHHIVNCVRTRIRCILRQPEVQSEGKHALCE